MRRLKSAARVAAIAVVALAGMALAAPVAAQANRSKETEAKPKSKKSTSEDSASEKSADPRKPSASTKSSDRSAKKEAETDDAERESSRAEAANDDLPTLEDAPVGPRQGSGQRKVSRGDSDGEGDKAAASSDKKEGDESLKSAPKRSHQRGPAPRRPQPVLPSGSPLPVPDAVARREIAGGPTRDELKQGTDDPELRALREAERVLFPKPLEGLETGWSWTDLPRAVGGDGERVVASGLPPDTRVQSLEPPAPSAAESAWLKTLAMPNLPVRLDAHVVKYLLFYRDNPRGKAIARVWAKKSGRYVTAMKAEFAKAGLPTDLVWMSLIESGHSPTIYSPAGAAGIWQFMPDAGRLYGLTVDRWVDERLDPQRSTEAAIRYMSDLHRRFGNWELAMAAYNMGYGGLSRAIRKFNTNDFWQLARYEAGVPWETTLYVPKILATAILMNNKKAFGIAEVAPDPAVRFDTVRVEPGLALLEVAQAAGVSAQNIEVLNPHYRISRTPPARPGQQPVQSWMVRVPLGKGIAVSQRLAKTANDETLAPYVVRFGDTAATIAARFRTTQEKLRLINRIGREEALIPGTVLLAPQLAPGEAPGSAAGDELVVVPPRRFEYTDRRRVFYRVLPGDTLSRVAQALAVTRAELLSWNALDTSARLQAGMVLQAFVSKDAPLDDVRTLKDDQTRVLVAGTGEFFDHFEAINGKKRIAVTIKEGDTLSSVGKRHGLSVGMMERINRRSRNDKLRPGETLIVYTQRATAPVRVAETDNARAQPLGPIDPPVPDVLPGSEGPLPEPAAGPGKEEPPPPSPLGNEVAAPPASGS
ncbi:MAG TPA: LysM peptidoglycan-binding domain-containing protein [Polyangiaceae bacterium]